MQALQVYLYLDFHLRVEPCKTVNIIIRTEIND